MELSGMEILEKEINKKETNLSFVESRRSRI